MGFRHVEYESKWRGKGALFAGMDYGATLGDGGSLKG